MKANCMRLSRVMFCAGIAGLAASPAARAAGYVVTNLVSDQPGVALHQDANLVNPWGLVASPTSPFWVANNGTGTSTVYTSTTADSASINALVVTIPGAGSVTGIVFNGGSGFALGAGSAARFIFSGEDGNITGWNGGTSGQTAVIGTGASYKGLAIGSSGGSDFLYATDFAGGAVTQFDSSFAPVGSLVDPNLPAGYAPFGAQVIGSDLYITYAVRNPATGDDVAGAGNGIVDVYGLDGAFQRRLATGGALNSPWGLAMAPADFGEFSGDLLVGNFGDGAINAYDPATGVFQGTLADKSGTALAIDGLWALQFGNGGNGGEAGTLYFTAGSGDESHGLFGSIAVPEPGTLGLLAGIPLMLVRRRRLRG